uniref:Katanin p80 WD40 repeat-containing subunit B1 homolog n=1 Tax=Brassica campestris TaxID=3711 RepID=M4ESH8_BRACM
MPFSAGVTNLRDVSAINNLYITLGAPSLSHWLAFGGDPCGEKWQGVVCDSSNITEIKDGTPFNTSIITPPPPAVVPPPPTTTTHRSPPPVTHIPPGSTVPPAPFAPFVPLQLTPPLPSPPLVWSPPSDNGGGSDPWNSVSGQPTLQISPPSGSGSGKFWSTQRIILVICSVAVIVLVSGLCVTLWRCYRNKKYNRYIPEARKDYQRPYFNKPPSQPTTPFMAKVSREPMVKPYDGYGAGDRLYGYPTPPRAEESRRAMPPTSYYNVNVTQKPLQQPPRRFQSNDAAATKRTAHFPPGLNTQSSATVFTVASLQQYTNSFSEEHIIGEGSLGNVYKAVFPHGKFLAVRKLSNTIHNTQSDGDFLNLVSNVLKLKRGNILEFLGYCNEYGQRLLVYEYCPNGSLQDALHLDRKLNKKLTWNVRMNIALGAAKALQFLHEVCQPPVVHQNFKSSKVLLDGKLSVRVADSGLAYMLPPRPTSQMAGYAAPEIEYGSYTCQSDVYSLGVVMLELLTGSRPFDRTRRRDQTLAQWAIPRLHDIDALTRMADPSLHGAYSVKSLSRFADIISRSLQSLCGHTSPIDSVTFNSEEALVLAGASSGVIKLWNLQEAKVVRGFTGHISNCSALEFHPFGQYLASGSSDATLKIWDIRKKGCIQTYKGHTRGISTVKFTPDGRWLVSGGLDNVVKIWDITAGKLLHEFKFHDGPIRSLDYHPLEFLLATGSADRTVKFWDLETFELIGSTRPEATGVRSIAFHPDGRTLFCGLDDSLKVYSWEPVICRDSVEMGWSTLGDFCINENKFVGCSYYRNSVGIWVSDISKLEPYGAGSEDENECMVKRFSVLDEQASERKGCGSRGSSSPDYETKEIKNIYVDSIGGTLKGAIRASEKQNADDKSSRMHSVVDSDSGEESSHSRSESVASSKTNPGMMLRPAHVRKTLAKFEESASVQYGTRKKSSQDIEEETQTRNAEDSTIKGIMYKFEKALSSEPPTDEATRMLHKPPRVQRSSYNNNHNESRRAMSVDSATLNNSKGGLEYSGRNVEDTNDQHSSTKTERVLSPEKPGDEQTIKVVSGRTRSLVERFERGEKITHTEEADNTNAVEQDPDKTSRQTGEAPVVVSTRRARSTPARVMPIVLNMKSDEPPSTQPARTSSVPVILNQSTNDEPSVSLTQSRTSPARTLPLTLNQATHIVLSRRPRRTSSARVRPMSLSQAVSMTSHECSVTSTRPDRTSPARVTQMLATPPTEIDQVADMAQDETHLSSQTDSDITENLMQTHEEFLSTLQSRLTKLQVQADVISILTDKIEILTLDMFSQLVPVLTSLLGSRTERPVNVSLDMLLKLVAVFGTVIRSTVTAPRIVGVDLHADERTLVSTIQLEIDVEVIS